MINSSITLTNKKTHQAEIIVQHRFQKHDWGISFYIESETDAYKIAYSYGLNHKKVDVDFCPTVEEWKISVYQ